MLAVALLAVAVVTLSPTGSGWAWGSPWQEVQWYAALSDDARLQLAGNLLLLTPVAGAAVWLWPALGRRPLLCRAALAAGAAIEVLQWVLPLGRVVSPVDALLNAAGATVAGGALGLVLRSAESAADAPRPRVGQGTEQGRLPQAEAAPRDRSLVVIMGLPGAGKTTLARQWTGPGAGTLLDSEQVAERLAPLTGWLGYARTRPLVHALHLVRVVVALCGCARTILLTDPGTSPARRLLVLGAARAAGRDVHLRLLDEPLPVALRGQRARRRLVPQDSMRRHHERWQRMLRELATTGALSGADSVVVLPARSTRHHAPTAATHADGRPSGPDSRHTAG